MAQKIFVIDDNEGLVKMVSRTLQWKNYKPIPFYAGKPALEEARKEKPYLMVVDINLPDIDGFSLCETIKKDKELSKIPIIIISGDSVETKDRIKGLIA